MIGAAIIVVKSELDDKVFYDYKDIFSRALKLLTAHDLIDIKNKSQRLRLLRISSRCYENNENNYRTEIERCIYKFRNGNYIFKNEDIATKILYFENMIGSNDQECAEIDILDVENVQYNLDVANQINLTYNIFEENEKLVQNTEEVVQIYNNNPISSSSLLQLNKEKSFVSIEINKELYKEEIHNIDINYESLVSDEINLDNIDHNDILKDTLNIINTQTFIEETVESNPITRQVDVQENCNVNIQNDQENCSSEISTDDDIFEHPKKNLNYIPKI